MSLPPETMLELMALVDGELEGDARDRVEQIVAQSAEARRMVDSMRSFAIGDLLAEVMSARADAATGIADTVMARIELEGTSAARPKASANGEARYPSRRDAELPPTVARLDEARARMRNVPRPLIAGALAALGVAAAVAIYLRSGSDEPDVRAPVASVGISSVDVQPPILAQGARPAQDVEVDQVESPHDITLFSIPVGGAAAAAIPGNPSSVVIMIDDEPGQQP